MTPAFRQLEQVGYSLSHWCKVFQRAYPQSCTDLRAYYSLFSSLTTSARGSPTLPGVMVFRSGTGLPGGVRTVAGCIHHGSLLGTRQHGEEIYGLFKLLNNCESWSGAWGMKADGEARGRTEDDVAPSAKT